MTDWQLGLLSAPGAYIAAFVVTRGVIRLWRCGLIGFWMTEAARKRRHQQRPRSELQSLPEVQAELMKRFLFTEDRDGLARDYGLYPIRSDRKGLTDGEEKGQDGVVRHPQGRP